VSTTSGIRVRGLDRVLRNMDKRVAKIVGAKARGIKKAGFLILRESNLIVPRDLSNLAASGYVISSSSKRSDGNFKNKEGGSDVATRMKGDHNSTISSRQATLPRGVIKPTVEVGYTAFYALYVHEDPNAKHKKGKEHKFLQKAVSRNKGRILDVIAKEVKVAV